MAATRNGRFLSTDSNNKVDEPFKVDEGETISSPPPPSEKLLVLGGNGFVGSHVCKEALARGLSVASLSRSGRSSINESWANNVIWHQGNLLSDNSWKESLCNVTAVEIVWKSSQRITYNRNCDAFWLWKGSSRDRKVSKVRRFCEWIRLQKLQVASLSEQRLFMVPNSEQFMGFNGGIEGQQKLGPSTSIQSPPSEDAMLGVATSLGDWLARLHVEAKVDISRCQTAEKKSVCSSCLYIHALFRIAYVKWTICDEVYAYIVVIRNTGVTYIDKSIFIQKCSVIVQKGQIFDDLTISCVGGFGSNSYMYKINGTANINAIRAAAEKGVKRFVYISAADFGLVNYLLQGYYEGKRAAETELLTKFPYGGVILRPGFIYGTRRVRSMKLPLGVIGSPLEMVLQHAKPLTQVPLIGPLLTTPVNVTAVAKVAVRAATDPVFPPGVIDAYGILRYSQQKSA
ncbi:NAD(P)-binding Rossmann-fold superfamily protein [Actinidia rufa]|uniref:NAD(P)-binding Rossmann-fold superfamily protein n=1 Tax=Actinidia rufa TaxID=165716 RepID=A0A7J0GBX7_9ERIC|nr:NAD(P)-binding Rossmann-fold superfamily protein [Actinidia rufa]